MFFVLFCFLNEVLFWEAIIPIEAVVLLTVLSVLGLLPDNISEMKRLWVPLAMTSGCKTILTHWKSSNLSYFG